MTFICTEIIKKFSETEFVFADPSEARVSRITSSLVLPSCLNSLWQALFFLIYVVLKIKSKYGQIRKKILKQHFEKHYIMAQQRIEGAMTPPPGPVKISHKKDGRQRRQHRFHVSRPPPPLPGRWICYCQAMGREWCRKINVY